MRSGSNIAPVLAVALALTACAEGGTPVAPTPGAATLPQAALSRGDRLATVEWEGSTPTLYLQDADGGNRIRVHFAHVQGHVKGNYTPRELPVTDEALVSIPRLKWSPDGRKLAVLVSPTYHASQVVVVSADGRSIRTVSPNSQVMYGDVEWSPDSRRVAYIVATGPFGRYPDLFVTDLGPDAVTRVTTNGQLSAYDAFRFDETGTRLFFTEHLGWAPDGVNVLSRLGTADLQAGAVRYGADVVGEPQGFARDGSWALFIRSGGKGRDLVKLSLQDLGETTLTSGSLYTAIIQEGDGEALVVSPEPNDPYTYVYSLLGLQASGDDRGAIFTPKGAAWVALYRAR